MKVLVTGAYGFVGSKTVTALLQSGFNVRIFDIPNHPQRENFAELWSTYGTVEIAEGDIACPGDVEAALEGCDRVLHSAALLNSIAGYSQFHRVNVQGTENICQLSLAKKISKVVIVSTSDVFGIPGLGQTLDESCDFKRWHEPYADSKIRAAQTARFYRDQKGLPVTIIYPGWVYGPGDRQFFPAIMNMIRDKHVFTWEKRTPYEINLIYIDDLVDALCTCLTQPASESGEYLIMDTGTFMTPAKLYQWIADALHIEIRIHHIPYSLMMVIALCSQWLARHKLIPRHLLSTTDVKAFGNDFHFSNQKAAAELQWKPVTPVADGLAASMEWQKKRLKNPNLVG